MIWFRGGVFPLLLLLSFLQITSPLRRSTMIMLVMLIPSKRVKTLTYE